jgi:hypothetical protein
MSVPRDKGTLGTQPIHQLWTRLGEEPSAVRLSEFRLSPDHPQVPPQSRPPPSASSRTWHVPVPSSGLAPACTWVWRCYMAGTCTPLSPLGIHALGVLMTAHWRDMTLPRCLMPSCPHDMLAALTEPWGKWTDKTTWSKYDPVRWWLCRSQLLLF